MKCQRFTHIMSGIASNKIKCDKCDKELFKASIQRHKNVTCPVVKAEKKANQQQKEAEENHQQLMKERLKLEVEMNELAEKFPKIVEFLADLKSQTDEIEYRMENLYHNSSDY